MNKVVFNFEKPKGRPFFFTSFVSTIDGKIMVKDKGYWPIGTKADYEYFTNLRTYADAIVDAKNTAIAFGSYTIKTINDESFKKQRKIIGKNAIPEYIVLTTNPNKELFEKLKNPFKFKTTILTTSKDSFEKNENWDVVKITNDFKNIDVNSLVNYLNSKDYEFVFIDGGPSLISEMLKEKVLDEIHLTIAPKIFGTEIGKTLTLAEGMLFEKNEIPNFKLEDVKRLGDEVVLRYIRSF